MKDLKKILLNARNVSEIAAASSRRHSSDLAHMTRIAKEARELLQQAQARQHDREAEVRQRRLPKGFGHPVQDALYRAHF